MEPTQYIGLFLLTILLPALASVLLPIWVASKLSDGLSHPERPERALCILGLAASLCVLAGSMLLWGGIFAGYDAAAGGAFNPGPNNWGMNLSVYVFVAAILLWGVWAVSWVALKAFRYFQPQHI